MFRLHRLLLFATVIITFSLATPAIAAPPLLTGLVVIPTVLEQGTGPQLIDVSVTITDPDGDINPAKVKATITFADGTKQKAVLVDDGTRRYSAQITIDTSTAQDIVAKVRAKDFANEKAAKLTTLVVITDPSITPTTITTEQTEWAGDSGEVIVLQTRVVNQDGPTVGIPNWPVTFELVEGDGVILESVEGEQLNEAQLRKDLRTAQGVNREDRDSITVLTDAQGFANLAFQIGGEPLNVLEAQAEGVPEPVTFKIITLGAPSDIGVEANGSLVVVDTGINGVVRIDPITGTRMVVSSNQTGHGSGPGLEVTQNLAIQLDGSIVVTNGLLGAVVRVDEVTGDRQVISGCREIRIIDTDDAATVDTECVSMVGAGLPLLSPRGATVQVDGSLIVVESFSVLTEKFGVQIESLKLFAVIHVDPATGDRTVISGCREWTQELQCTSMVGTGPNIRLALDVVVGADGALMVVSAAQMVVRVDPVTGDRSILSGCSDPECSGLVGQGPNFDFITGSIDVQGDGSLVVSGLNEIYRVNPTTGDRTVISGCRRNAKEFELCADHVGTGPEFLFLGTIASLSDGSLVATDSARGSIVRVTLPSGNRTVITTAEIGKGPSLQQENDDIPPIGVAVQSDHSLVTVMTGPSEAVFVNDRIELSLSGLVKVDPTTGDRTLLSGCGRNCDRRSQIGSGPDLLFPRTTLVEADGSVLVAGFVNVLRINLSTGERSVVIGCHEIVGGQCIGPVGDGPGFGLLPHVALEPDGSIVMAANLFLQGSMRILSVNPISGDHKVISGCIDDLECLNPIGTGPLLDSPKGIAVEADGSVVVVGEFMQDESQTSGFQLSKPAILRINPVTGDRTIVHGCADSACTHIIGTSGVETVGIRLPVGIVVEPGGSLVVARAINNIVRVHPQTGAVSAVSGCVDFDLATSQCRARVGRGTDLREPAGITIDKAGTLFVTDFLAQVGNVTAVIRVDPITGDRTTLSR